MPAVVTNSVFSKVKIKQISLVFASMVARRGRRVFSVYFTAFLRVRFVGS